MLDLLVNGEPLTYESAVSLLSQGEMARLRAIFEFDELRGVPEELAPLVEEVAAFLRRSRRSLHVEVIRRG